MVSVTNFREPINAFIYYLVDGHKTKISEGEMNLEAKTALNLDSSLNTYLCYLYIV